MQDTIQYHEDVIKYNEILAKSAAEAEAAVENETVKKWCVGIRKQHEAHANRHKRRLNALVTETQEPPRPSEVKLEDDEIRRLDAIIDEVGA